MKKFFSFVLIIAFIFTLTACDQAENNEPISVDSEEVEEPMEVGTIEEYYPFVKNRNMEYKGIGNEYAAMNTFVEFMEDDLVQIKKSNAGTDVVTILEYKDGNLMEVFAESEFYHIENMLDANRNMENILLKEPLEIGNSWKDKDGNKVEITALDMDIETPLENYKALEVTTEYKEGANKKDYYAKDIGFVASIYEDGEFKVETLLEKIEDKPMDIPIKVYYPTSEDIGSKYELREIKFNTNDNPRLILEKLLKNPDSEKLLPPISQGASIKSISLDRDNWNVKIDLSQEFTSEMNAGSSYEIEIINSIVNTLGNFYDVERVYLTVEGNPYESGHLQLLEDEYFEVDIEGIEKLE